MDLVIFTGSVSDDELRHERAAQYERLKRSGELERLVVQPPPTDVVRRAYVYGTIGLMLGVGLFVLIAYAVIL
jgi:hypothetical protein